jgi:hypothetical protein
MSVSITSGNVDMDAIIAGGPALLQRLDDFKTQRDTAVQALADLALGKTVAEARDQLARDRAAFEQEKADTLDQLGKQVASIKADTDAWKRAVVAKHMADSEAAAADRAEAEKLLSDAKAERAAAAAEKAANDEKAAALDAAQKAFTAAQAALSKVVL